jgi:thermitase
MKVKEAFKTALLLLALTAVVALPLLLWAAPVQGSPPDRPAFASGRILVKFDPGTSPAERAAVHRLQGGKPIRVIPGIAVEVVSVPERAEEARAAGYARNPHVIYAEPDYIAHAVADPDDEFFVKQWGLDNDGQDYDDRSGTPDADIDAPEAWDLTTGSPGVLIAILDSGIDQDHPDLDDKLVENKANFTTSSTADDNYGHGTHVAGIAAAETNNGLGVAGIGYHSSLLNVKVLDDQGWGAYSWIVDGITWAVTQNARVINMSLGGYNRSRTLQAAVDYAWEQGVLLAAAAGNDGTSRRLYPAAYANCMAVAATDDDDQRVDEPGWWASNYGDWVDVAAPGLYVYSTFPNHPYAIGKALSYDYGSGTSMATPFVAGLAGLLFGQDPDRTHSEVRALIQNTADPIPGTGTYWTYGRINAHSAAGGGGGELATMHVSAVTMWASASGKNYFVYTAVTIVDENNSPVPDATVDLTTTLPDGSTSSASGVTGADGVATFKVRSRQTGKYVSEVLNAAHAFYTYDPDANVETGASLDVP